MPLTDFYASNENAYRGSLPPGLTDIDQLQTSAWTSVSGSPNVYKIRFSTYIPKIVSEAYSDRALYGRPYTRMMDVQSLTAIIHGGYYYDIISKDLYVKCFNLIDPSTTTIMLSPLQGIEARADTYYVHQSMRIAEQSGIKWEATIGLGERFINGANLTRMDDFFVSCLVVDPEQTDTVPVKFPSLTPIAIENVKFPGSSITYYVNDFVDTLTQLINLDVSSYVSGQIRYVEVRVVDIYDSHIIFRYDPTASIGDVAPLHSNKTGIGSGNGWWIKVYGLELERVILNVGDIAELAALATVSFSHLQLRKVLSNDQVYQYNKYATSGDVQALHDTGWWSKIDSDAINNQSYVYNANHFGFSLKYNTSLNKMVLMPLTMQQLNGKFVNTADAPDANTQVAIPLEGITKGSFKIVAEIKQRTGTPQTLDYTIKISQVVTYPDFNGNTIGTETIYSGTLLGVPTTGNFGNYLTGISISEGVIIDDLVVSEIIESVA